MFARDLREILLCGDPPDGLNIHLHRWWTQLRALTGSRPIPMIRVNQGNVLGPFIQRGNQLCRLGNGHPRDPDAYPSATIWVRSVLPADCDAVAPA